MIKLLRVDDRLIHGQVAVSWTSYLGADTIVVANDKAITDKLMQMAFSRERPLLRLNQGSSASEADEQLGYMQLFAGCMTGVRNPRAHDANWKDSKMQALQLLVFAEHLIEKVEMAQINEL